MPVTPLKIIEWNLETICAVLHPGLTTCQVLAWPELKCKSYPETKKLLPDGQADGQMDAGAIIL